MKKGRWEKDNVVAAIKVSKTYSGVLRYLGLKPFCGNFRTLKKYICMYNSNISHFSRKLKGTSRKITLKEILVKNSTYSNISNLKMKLIANSIMENKCSKCGLKDIWNKEPIKMILDHINGEHNDHRLDNLRFICPNCNSQLPTNCGKNIKNKKSDRVCKICDKKISQTNKSGLCLLCYRKERNIRAITYKKKPSKSCNICNSAIWGDRYCRDCARELRRKVERPNKENLMILVESIPMLKIAARYKVSSKTIKKWCNSYNIFLGDRRGYWAKKYSIT